MAGLLATSTESERVVPGRTVHWYWPDTLTLCDDYAMGENVVAEDRSLVDCDECLDWMHA